MAAIRCAGLGKRFGAVWALLGVDLAIRDREFMVLVGPSGCGKTTLLRLIAGLEEPTTGEIHLGERRIDRVPAKDRDIAMVFQSYALYPHLTVYDNLAFALRLRGLPRAEIDARVSAAAERLGLTALLARLPRELSGGQRQRVALGRAIVRQPAAYLFDEPLSNLDAQLRAPLRAELKALQQSLATTAVYVTHDQVEAMTLGDRIAVLRAGRLEQVGAPLDLYRHPWNRFVAGFLGSPGIALVPGRLDAGRDPPQLLIDGGVRLPLATEHGARLPAHHGAELWLGLRPEHLRVGAEAGGSSYVARVQLTEHLGDHQLVHLEWQGRALIARAAADSRFAIGEAIPLAIDTRHAPLFAGDRDDSENLVVPPGLTRFG